MAFFRKFFRGNQQQSPPPEQGLPAEQSPSPEQGLPAEQSAPVAEPESAAAALPEAQGATPWWQSSDTAMAADSPDIDATAPLRTLAEQSAAPVAGPEVAEEEAGMPGGTTPLNPERVPDGTRELATNSEPVLMPARSLQGLAAAALRDIGRVRSINQDSVFALLTSLPRASSDVQLGLFVVADGMGGHEGGEVASRLAITSVVRHVLGQLVLPALEEGMVEDLQTLMIAAVEEANRTIWDQARVVGSDMGTTCTAVLLLGSALYIAHVGDSRAYVLEAEALHQLSSDHSAVGRLIQVGQLAPSEAREHPLRNQLYRTVGQHPHVQVDFVYHALGEATHLLMGSDGLWGMLEDADMAAVLRATRWPMDACRELVALANLAGGEDNISAVVVAFSVAEEKSS